MGIHGLIISFRDPDTGVRRSATYLPEIAHREGWTVRYTVESLCRKSGFNVRETTRHMPQTALPVMEPR